MGQKGTKSDKELFGWNLSSWVEDALQPSADPITELVYCTTLEAAQSYLERVTPSLPDWAKGLVKLEEGDMWNLPCSDLPRILVKPKALTDAQTRDRGRLAPSPFSQARDLFGRALVELRRLKLAKVRVQFIGAGRSEKLGALVGLDMAAYSYKTALNPSANVLPQLELDLPEDLKSEAVALARGTNIARHLVNTPPNILYPESFAGSVARLFQDVEGISISVWDQERLEREGMGLHLAVGNGSEHRPCLLHVRYRPKSTQNMAPLALVGKGITFDSGGLDIKDPAGMRLMKKDMGGAAAVVGALFAAVHSELPRPLDIYVPLAENAISGRAFRPSDVVRAKNGMTVEIHNTDAEGRLVLADAIAVAATQEGVDRPAALIVAATLTGAIKVGLGSDVAGLFSNDDALCGVFEEKSQEFGDLMWRMPLFDAYRPKLETTTADINHCATGSYGGAITAALFLVEFAKGFPFVHLDIYAWTDGERGALREAGGSGQAVSALLGVLKSYQW